MTEVVTFGCRLNAYESEVIRRNAAAAGLVDTVVVNTCAVTAEAERQARQAIRRLRRERPTARLVVTGCSAQVSPERYAAMAEVDAVVGNAEKLDPAALKGASAMRVGDIMAASETAGHLIDGFEGRARAFIQVQNGCDHRCTFCIIPYGRGPSRSVAPDEVVAQVALLHARGYREVVLTGVDIGDYGKDLPCSIRLSALVSRVLETAPDDLRLRLTSIDPVEVDRDLLDLYAADARLMPHWHLSVQAGDDDVLRRMARRHRRSDVLGLCETLRGIRADTVVGADLIAGFPTETGAQFANTLALVDEARLALLHVFPYSERAGTPAARWPAPPKAERRARAAALREAGAAQLDRTLQGLVGRRASVVVEQGAQGRTEHFLPVALDREAASGSVVAARMTGVAGQSLTGAVVDG